MTNKELIDFCNDYWYNIGDCCDCPHKYTYCSSFIRKTKSGTPYREDYFDDGKFYTDEEIEI